MATQRPVIAGSKVGGARDLVTAGVTGWTFESGNLQQLVAVVKRALECDRATVNAMSAAAGLESARWSVEAAAAGLESAVLQFASGQRVRQFAKSSHEVLNIKPQARTSPIERG